MNLQLSILDQSPIDEGKTPAKALQESLDLAVFADPLGFRRYWVAEHHHSSSFAGTAPELLMASLLERTRNLQIGSGGILLPRYPAHKVFELASTLASLHPGRVDLGLGRAGGPAGHYPQQIRDVLRLAAQWEEINGLSFPEMFLLGAGLGSAPLAGELGLQFAYAHFLNPDAFPEATRAYRAAGGTHAILALRVVTGETAQAAAEHLESVLLWRSQKDLGQEGPLRSPQSAAQHHWNSAALQRRVLNLQKIVSGTPDQVHRQIRALAERHGVSEVMVNSPVYSSQHRQLSYGLLAEAFRLQPVSLASA